ncbi:PREDICTED: unconventional myosin-Va [Papilio polytes]|uniref:unconventional myosin-Va n=1 Tax=Papilio polytes TaxID=76194 RepID=UPI0006766B55|nr:PREDICTED: unconventional myosin-Va [Papilio polytes]
MTTKELYTKDARVWVEHPVKVWEGATVTSDYRSGVLIVKIDQTGEIRQIKIKDENQMPPLRNPSLLIGENDLTSLSYLHEPAVLHNLKVRFCDRNAIYTYCGIVLVAINPYYDLPIYGDETIMMYRGQAMGDLDPHIFAVSEEAYTKLERERRDQSIIVSGESGAGKTVSAKYAMRYFAAVGGNASETQVERKVLASSPIMESIGNAKTTRNDNSSRFGKFIEIHFDEFYRISGASMRTYLLEKSRVVYQSAGERNYHIFYQLCAASVNMPELQLDHQDSFQYLNQGGSPNIDGVDDLRTFNETRNALTTLGVSETEQANMFTVLATVLHLGNIQLYDCDPDAGPQEDGADGAHISSNDKHLHIVCSLLGISKAELSRWLTHRRIASAHEVIVSRMDVQRAAFARDALAKRMYGELFAWLVRAVNRALDTGHAKKHFIGVLDIYGFETFEINSFEQFCINYANEKLQQQFNSHVFKLEQDEYIKEEISWKMIDFYDNQPCIDLIEERLGVLALLDEECRVPQGSDAGFVAKLHQNCTKYPHFMKPRFGNAAFIIKHFADNVEYQCGGFLEKNRDTVSEEQLECIKSATSCRLIHTMFAEERAEHATATLPPPSRRRTTPSLHIASLTQPPRRASGQKQTVGAQFRASLSALMSTLSATTPHYVRCIKPNDTKQPFSFDPARAVHQLSFFHRYRLLCLHKDVDRTNIKATCGKILKKHLKDPDKYQFGATKIFFRAGQVAYLEKIRAEIQRLYCVRVQSCVRRFVARRRYLRLLAAIRGLQAHARGYLARRRVQEVRRNRAAIKIQRNVRGWLARRTFQRLRRLATGLQAHARGYLARRLYRDRRRVLAVITIQRYARGYLARKRVKKMKRQIVIAQAAIRRFLARRQYKRLRIEARSLDHVKSLNKGLENKIISLQQRLGDVVERAKCIEPLQAQIADLKAKLEALKLVEIEAKTLRVGIHERDSLIASLETELKSERDSNKRLVEEKNEVENKYNKHKDSWLQESNKLAEELKTSKECYEMAIEGNKCYKIMGAFPEPIVKEAEEATTKHVDPTTWSKEFAARAQFWKEQNKQHEAEKRALCAELEAERQSRQKLLSSQYELQERLDTMQRAPATKEHRRSLSDASNASQQETTVEDDYGYGSVRSVETSRPALEAVNWSAGQHNGPAPPIADAGLVLRMQNRISALQSDLSRTSKRANDLEERLMNRLSSPPSNPNVDRFKVEELEIENKKLREHLDRLRASTDSVLISKEVIDQMSTMQKELDRRRDECIQLKSVLTTQTVNLKSLATSNYGSDVDIINEDGELASAYEAQKDINRQLQEELIAEKKFYSEHISKAKAEIERLREETDKYSKLLSDLSQEPKNKSLEYAQNEIIRLTTEYLALQERVDKLSESCRRYKNQIRLLANRLKEAGIEDVNDILEGNVTLVDTSVAQQSMSMIEMAPVTRKKEREYLGMFEYKIQDEPTIIKKLIIDLKPRVAVTLLPGLPAYILFMMLRHMDHVDDEPKMHQLMKAVRTGVKKTLKKRTDSVEYNALWLSNMLRLLNNLRQYSGDAIYQGSNTPRQNQQCLRIFDLSEYRQVLSDIAVWIYQALVHLLERQLERLILPAILEYEEINVHSRPARAAPAATPPGPARLIHELAAVRDHLRTYNVDTTLTLTIFKQLFYYICAYSLNQLLLRKDLCCWAKGLQIRYNISHLEIWIKEHLAEYGQKSVEEILGVLKPITQAVQLLQARKSMSDVDSTVDMCADLTAMQVCKILNMYTPAEEYEVKVTRDFIHEIQKKMQERAGPKTTKEPQNLLMDTKMIYSVQFPFNPSPIRLEDIEVPEVLELDGLLTKI